MNGYEEKLKRAVVAIKKLKQQIKETNTLEPIAVVGAGCRFPGGVTDLKSFWNVLVKGVDTVSEVPKTRWDLEEWFDGDQDARGKMYSRWGGFLPQIDQFDPGFFGISPREAASIDPQQRLLLEVAWEALENAGETRDSLKDSDTGVYLGICGNDYQIKALADVNQINAYSFLGTAHSAIAGRLSYCLGLKGPNVALDTACSSSLVAVHMAVQALRNGECEQAIAGGVSVVLNPEGSVYFSRLKAISPTGRCHTFSADADGFVRSEGCGILVLKRLSVAQAAGDDILAVVRSSAINQDGNSQGFTAPNGPSQQAVIRKALAQGNIEPSMIDYIEAHGTGTKLGDPIEVNALDAVFSPGRTKENPLLIGSVKTNIGHAEGAAGVAGILKTILAFQHQRIPQNIHFDKPSPHISWDSLPIKVVDQTTDWKTTNKSRLAGISSFGFSGTNAHVVLEEAPRTEVDHQPELPEVLDKAELIVLSAKNKYAVTDYAKKLKTYLQENPNIQLSELAFSLAQTKSHFSVRRALVAKNRTELLEQLDAIDPNDPEFTHSDISTKVAFQFTGQGAQYWQMGKGLYDTDAVFRAHMDKCAELLQPILGEDILTIIYGEESSKELINETIYAQPALFALEYALCQKWLALGVEPSVLIGHSVGEIVAACIAGVFSLEDALLLIANRGKLMQATVEDGAMLVVKGNLESAKKAVEGMEKSVSIAAENTARQNVISGDRTALLQISKTLNDQGISTKLLKVSHAFHSPLIEPMLEAFAKTLEMITFHSPQIPIISNVTGKLVDQDLSNATYWVQHVRNTVKYTAGIHTIESLDVNTVIEIGPHPLLTILGPLNLSDDSTIQWISSLHKHHDDARKFLENLGQWYRTGAKVNWPVLFQDQKLRKLKLPTYCFQRKRYWLEEPQSIPRSTKIQNPMPPVNKVTASNGTTDARMSLSELENQLLEMITVSLKMEKEELSPNAALLEIGADSIIIMEVLKKIERTFKVKIPVRKIFEELTNIRLLAKYLFEHQPVLPKITQEPSSNGTHPAVNLSTAPATFLPAAHTSANGNGTTTAPAINDHIYQLMINQQELTTELLKMLRASGQALTPAPVSVPVTLQSAQNGNGTIVKPSENGTASSAKQQSTAVLPSFGVKEKTGKVENPYVLEFIEAYCKQTTQSKNYTNKYRPTLADNRASAGFRFSTKELLYPIVSKASKGAYLTDIDQNEYIDITMGFGSNIFGHQPAFVVDAIQSQLNAGIHIGPQSHLVGEVSKLFTTITGADRVCFVNTGTEAVMTAIRIARSVTARKKIVTFKGAYHGHFDGILGVYDDYEGKVEPITGGTPEGMVEDLLTLDYCDEASLKIIQEHAADIAGVLVEPVQSRHPEQKPQAFLKALRTLTEAENIPLIFDEMITGFRIMPGGAQQFFDIKADIATYGKILGGGMPIGAIAGAKKYLDAIDGGVWQYGDQSYPEAETTFLAGTFSKHPLAMAASGAVLARIKEIGDEAYLELNKKCSNLVEKLNTFFEIEGVEIRVANFGSLFRFSFKSNQDLFFYHLIKHGLYIWEGRNCFLSFAHSDGDIDSIFKIIKQSILELIQGGVLRSTTAKSNGQIKEKHAGVTAAFDQQQAIPLTTAQKQLWVLDRVDKTGSLAYLINTNVELKGKLNVDHLKAAIQATVADQTALQCCINETGTHHQLLDSSDELRIVFEDYASYAGAERMEALEKYLDRQRTTTFDLSKDRLIRFQVIKLSETYHVLAIQAHHIVFDGISMEILMSQIAEKYSAKCAGEPIKEVAKLSYSEYQHQQALAMHTPEMKEHETFWVNEFQGMDTALNFPTDGIASAENKYQGNSIKLELDQQLFERLSAVARANGGTQFMLLLSAYATWLHRLSGQEHVILGFPVSGRFLEDELDSNEKLIGFYSHLLPLKSQQHGDESFISFFKKTIFNLLSAFEHQAYPYSDLLQSLSVDRKEEPFIHTVFNIDKVGAVPTMTDLDLAWLPTKANYTNMDFKMNITDFGDHHVLEFIYRTDLFQEATIKSYLNNFVTLLTAISNTPDVAVKDLSILEKEEKEKLLFDFNDTKRELSKGETIVSLFEKQVALYPKREALVFEKKTLSYQELDVVANQLAQYLTANYTIEPEQVLAIKLDRSEWMVIAILAVLKTGAAYLPIEVNCPAERVKYMMEDSQAIALVDKKEIERFQKNQHLYNGAKVQITLKEENLAYIIYTSGSTGRPKGVAVEQGNLINYITWFIESNQGINLDRSLLLSTYTFDGVYTSVYGTLLNGGALHVLPQSTTHDPDKLLEQIKESGIAFIKITPSYLHLLLQCEEVEEALLHAKDLSLFVVGGEAIIPTDIERIAKLRPDIKIMNHYGPTEVTIGMCAYPIPPDQIQSFMKTPLIGRPIDNTQVFILDKFQKPVPVGCIGEIYASGLGVARGYVNNEKMTREKFVSNPFNEYQRMYRTGDLGRWKADGNIELLGRADEQVKINGYRIELGEIEAVLCKKEAVKKAALITVIQPSGKKELVAFVMSEEEISISDYRIHLRQHLPDYMIPLHFVRLAELPLTTNGKVDKKRLVLPAYENTPSEKPHVSPRNEEEAILVEAWKEVLKKQIVGATDNFFELGGDSIKSIQVVSLVKAAGYQISVEAILRQPNLEDLAKLVKPNTRQIDQKAIEGLVDLAPIQKRFFYNESIPVKPHYNQSVLLESKERISKEGFEKCIKVLVAHHDALRMSYRKEGEQWIQESQPDSYKSYSLNVFELRNKKNEAEWMEKLFKTLQSKMNLENGPLIKIGLFKGREQDQVAIIVHHLLIDGVSWRILLEDLERLYSQYEANESLSLAPKTDAYQTWTNALNTYVSSPALAKEIPYWQQVISNQVLDFPTDLNLEVSTPTARTTQEFSLSKTHTDLLKNKSYQAYQTDHNEILLTALGLALKEVLKTNRANVLLEGHGRENIGEDIDSSRTIGWFTSVFPFILEVSKTDDVITTLVQVKEASRKIPNKGLGYGVYKYLHESPDLSQDFQTHVAFNYLGDFGYDATTAEEATQPYFRPIAPAAGQDLALENDANGSCLDVMAMMIAGKLKVSLAYFATQYQEETIARFMTAFQKHLEGLIDRLATIKQAHITPSDLTYTQLNVQELNAVNEDQSIADIYPLTPLQEGMYFHWLSDTSSSMYFIQRAYRLDGKELSIDALQKSFELLVDQYDILRTSFDHEISERTLQLVRKSVMPDFHAFSVVDINSAEEKEQRIATIFKNDRAAYFDLRSGSQIRLTVIELGNDEYQLIWSYHHILMDGWCANLLLNAFDEILTAIQKDETPTFKKITPYSDYIKWLAKIDQKKTIDYWRNYVADYSTAALVPYLEEDKTNQVFTFQQESLRLEGEAFLQLKKQCQKVGVTESILIQSAWGYLLSKYNNTNDVIFGTVVSGRSQELDGVTDMVGLFINTIPVRVRYDQSFTVRALLEKIQDEAIQGLPHHFVGLSEIQAQSELGGNLFSHILEFENYLVQTADDTSENGTPTKSEIESFEHTHYPLAVVISPEEEALTIHLNFNREVYALQNIKKIKTHLQNVIQFFIKNLDKKLLGNSFLSPQETERLVINYNATKVDYPTHKTLANLFEEQVLKTPDQTALVFGGEEYTYAALYEKAKNLAGFLQNQKTVFDQPIPIISHKSVEQIWGVLGILMAGAHYVPIKGSLPARRINELLAQTNPSVILAQSNHLDKVDSAYKGQVCLLEEKTFEGNAKHCQTLEVAETNLAYIIFTSGSTGKPKGVMIDHRGAVNTIYDMNARFEITDADRIFGISDLNFDLSVYDIFGTFACGATLVLPNEEETTDPEVWLSYIEKQKLTVWNSVPQLVNLLMDAKAEASEVDMSSLRLYWMSGDWIPVNLPAKIKSANPRAKAISLGGATEGSIWSIYFPIDQVQADWNSIPYGRPLSNQEIYILNDALEPCPEEVTGGIYIGGKGVAKGYYKDAEKTANSFIEHPQWKKTLYRTGDMGYHHPDGYVKFLGRLDGQVKIRGYRIELGEIEITLQKHPEIESVVLSTTVAGTNDKELVAYFVANRKIAAQEIRTLVSQDLPDYMVPAYVIQLPELPLTPNGKVNKKALPPVENNLDHAGRLVEENRTDTEQKLAEIWASLLEVDVTTISIQDNFFEIGGHSIKAIRLISQINKSFGIKLKVQDIFANVSIQEQATLLSNEEQNTFENIPSIPVQNGYALSPAQMRLWVICQFEATNIAYNMSGTFELKGVLDIEVLQQSFIQVINRHEILRTVFKPNEKGEVLQYVKATEDLNFKIEIQDLQQETEADQVMKDQLAIWKGQAFDLENGSLLKTAIFQLAPTRNILFFNMHHIISDGWSMDILIKEVVAFYLAATQEDTVHLKALPIQYKDYAHWQNQRLEESQLQTHKAYWLEQFTGEIPVLQLPEEFARPAIQTHRGAKVAGQLSEKTAERLSQIVAAQNGTLFMGLLAGVKALLYKYTSQSDIIIGSPTLGRDHTDLESQIGFYINTLALRTQFQGADSFLSLLQKVKETTLGAYDHQIYPFHDLIDNLDIQRDMSRSPLFDVMVDLQLDTEQDHIVMGAIEMLPYPSEHITCKTDLSFDFFQHTDTIKFTIEYNTDIYGPAQMEAMANHFSHLMDTVCEQLETSLDTLDYLKAEEHQQLLSINHEAFTTINKAQTIVDLFEKTVKRAPQNIAIKFEETSLSYQELDEISNQLAHYLIVQQARPEALIGVMLERSEWMIIAVLAVLKTGHAYVPVDPEYPQSRIDFMLQNSACETLIDEALLRDFMAQRATLPITKPVVDITPENLAYVIYTSGSSGRPKGVMVEHRNLTSIALAWKEAYELEFGSTVLLQMASISFDVFFGDICRALLTGGTMIICPAETRLDWEGLYDLMAKHQVSIFEATPGLILPYMEWLWQSQKEIGFLKTLILGSDEFTVQAYFDLQQKFGAQMRIINSYGTTEAAIDSTWFEEAISLPIYRGSTPIGRPYSNTQVYILDEHLNPVPIGVTGEIVLGGKGVARGYWQDPVLTEKKFVASPFVPGTKLYRTGDAGKHLRNGQIVFLGRKDEQVKIRGYRIDLSEIRAALEAIEKIKEVAVVVNKEAQQDKELIAYLVSDEKLNPVDLRNQLSERLPAYMLPDHFVMIPHIPLSPNGKVDKKNLPKPENILAEKGQEHQPPQNSQEEALQKIWSEVLRKPAEAISVQDSFFDLGGHSLKAIRLLSFIHQRFEVRLSLHELFTHVTIRKQGELIARATTQLFESIPIIAPAESYRLSSAQKRMWVLSQIEKANIAYNIFGAIKINGTLQSAFVETALQQVIQKYEILRTRFRLDEQGEVRQYIFDPERFDFKLSVENLEHEKEATTLLNHRLNELVATPFDLEKGPLLKATLFKISEEQYVFFLNMHHIISDGWSIEILIKEILSNYLANVNGTPVAEKALAIQYKDFAHWEQNQLSQTSTQKHRAYWLEQLSGDLPVLELPTDHPRPEVQTYRGRAYKGTLSSETTQAFNALIRAEEGTLFMGLLTVLNVLMHRYSGAQDLIIGSPIAGREHIDLEDQVGLYVNTIALRTKLQTEANFSSLLKNIKQVTLDAYEHQMYPFDHLVDELDLTRDLSRSAIFDVMMVLQNNEDLSTEINLGGLDYANYPLEYVSSKFDLLFNFSEENGQISYTIEYNSDLYNEARIERMSVHFQKLINAVLKDQTKPISRLDYLSKSERHQLIEVFNATDMAYDKTLTVLDLFEKQVKKQPNATALVFEKESYTFKQLNQLANQLGNYLRKDYAVNPEDIVGVKLERSEWMIISILGVLKAGGAYLPIDPKYPEARVDYLLKDSEAKVLIDEKELQTFVENQDQYSKRNRKSKLKSNSLFYVIYTSGSTGQPKGCMLEHQGVVNRIEWMWKHYNFTSKDVILQKTTNTFDVSVWEIFMPLAWGCKMILANQDDISVPDRLLDLVEQQQITCLHFVPSMLELFVQYLEINTAKVKVLKTLDKVITSGEALPMNLLQRWYQLSDTSIFNLYGPTEASIDVSYFDTSKETNKVLIGAPIANTQLFIVDDYLQPVPLGVKGEICISGDGLARGYLNKPALTQERFVKNPFKENAYLYKTGDLGRWESDGKISFIGRKDNQVKIRGHRIELGEVEAALQQYPEIKQAVVLAPVNEKNERELTAYLVSDTALEVQAIRSFLTAALPDYMIPVHFVQLDTVPLTSSGKVDRKAIAKSTVQKINIGSNYQAPTTTLQKQLVALWAEVLDIKDSRTIGIYDNFFDLGGHSLKAVTILNQIEAQYQIKVDLADFFKAQNIDALVKLIEIVGDLQEEESTEVLNEDNQSELIF